MSTLAKEWRRELPGANPGFRDVEWDAEVEVPVTTLDALIEVHGVPKFCKIDVEGWEAEALAGLSRPVRGLSVEFVSGRLDAAVACVRRLRELGAYEFNAVAGEGRDFLFAEWIQARRMVEWLDGGAGGAASGDLYARRRRGERGTGSGAGAGAPRRGPERAGPRRG